MPKNVEYIKNQDFISDWFREKRPLIVSEITHISLILLANELGRELLTGFSQVSKTKKVFEYMFIGRDISTKKIDLFTSILTSENIAIPSTSYAFVTDSTVAPFSGKLMMFQITTLGSIAISNDGMAMAETLRTDLQMKFMRIIPEVMRRFRYYD